MCWKFDNSIVDEWVAVLPKRCKVCGGRCYQVKDYKYACRCADCSCYYHIELLDCESFEAEGYSCFLCCAACHNTDLHIYEIVDGQLAQVCGGCAEWLDDMELINKEPLHSCRVVCQSVHSYLRFRDRL